MDLLDHLSHDLWEESHRWVPAALGAAPPNWVWAGIARAQNVPPGFSYHLPAPMFGYVPRPQVLVVGQNPNVDFNEDHPTLDAAWNEARYAAFFRNFFSTRVNGKPAKRMLGGTLEVEGHYDAVEACLLGAGVALGTTAVYADLIPWKSSALDHKLLTAPVRAAARDRISGVVQDLSPLLIVGLGNIVHEVLFGQLDPPRVRSFPAFLPVPAPAAWGKQMARIAPQIGAEIARHLTTSA